MAYTENEYHTGPSENYVCGPYKVSWLAYVPATLGTLLVVGIASTLVVYTVYFGLSTIVVALSYYVYRVLYLRSVRLYADDIGVWLFRGILPWAKGAIGVKWRDVQEAVYFQSFLGWVFKAYTVRVGHRFTRESEITVAHIQNGDKAVTALNQYHQGLIRRDASDDLPLQTSGGLSRRA